jgi:hypothetical protein
MNFALKLFVGRQLALANKNVTSSQATTDGLIGALIKSPLGLLLAAFLARGQEQAAEAAQTPGTGTGTTTAPVAPAITTQPTAQSVAAGSSATFSVVATGVPAPAYQWFRANISPTTGTLGSSAAINGANSATYSFTTSTADDQAVFNVLVGNSAGVVLSSAATLTLTTPSAAQAPAVQVPVSPRTTPRDK